MPTPALLSDIGNVLVLFDFSLAARRYAEQSAFAEIEVLAAIEPLKVPLESGQLPAAEFTRQGMELIQFRGTAAEFQQIWCDIFTLNKPMADLVARLDSTMPKYLLSNTNDLHKEFLFRQFPVFGCFDNGVYSHLAGCMKPGEQIFRTAIAELKLAPELTFYIDDLPDNIATARQLGFVCHLYQPGRHSECADALAAWRASLS